MPQYAAPQWRGERKGAGAAFLVAFFVGLGGVSKEADGTKLFAEPPGGSAFSLLSPLLTPVIALGLAELSSAEAVPTEPVMALVLVDFVAAANCATLSAADVRWPGRVADQLRPRPIPGCRSG